MSCCFHFCHCHVSLHTTPVKRLKEDADLAQDVPGILCHGDFLIKAVDQSRPHFSLFTHVPRNDTDVVFEDKDILQV